MPLILHTINAPKFHKMHKTKSKYLVLRNDIAAVSECKTVS